MKISVKKLMISPIDKDRNCFTIQLILTRIKTSKRGDFLILDQENNDSAKPLYKQLADLIENEILSGTYTYGDKLPSEGELIEQYHLSRVTVRNALQRLTDKEIILKKQGKGAFVAFPVYTETFSAGGSFTSSGKSSDKSPTSEILAVQPLTLSDKRKLELGFDKNKVLSLERLRKIEGHPVIYEIDFLHLEMGGLVSELREQDSLIDQLKDHHYKINHFDNVLDVYPATQIMAEVLKIEKNTPLLHIRQQVLDATEKLIYVNEQFIRSELYKATMRSY